MNEMQEILATTGRKALDEQNGYQTLDIKDIKPEPDNSIADDPASLRAAAEELSAKRRGEDKPTETAIHWNGAENAAFADVETATAVLEGARNVDRERAATDEALSDLALGDLIDEHRGVERESDKIAREHREAQEREYNEQMVAAHNAQQAAEAQARAADLEGETIRARGNATVAALTSEFPEINNLPLHMINGAYEAIKAKNPQRAEALRQRLVAVDQIYGQHKAHQARQQQHATAQHNAFMAAEGQAFDRSLASTPKAERDAIYSGMIDVLKSAGIDPVAFGNMARQPNDLGRMLSSASTQRILYEAAKAMRAGKDNTAADLKSKLVPQDVAPVQRPGQRSASPATNYNGPSNAKLAEALSSAKGDSALKIAHQLLMNRRNAR
jgi:hypothetical protein